MLHYLYRINIALILLQQLLLTHYDWCTSFLLDRGILMHRIDYAYIKALQMHLVPIPMKHLYNCTKKYSCMLFYILYSACIIHHDYDIIHSFIDSFRINFNLKITFAYF